MEQINIAGFTGTYYPAQSTPKATPIVFIHGAFTDHKCFDKIAVAFSNNGYNVYAVSRRGRLGQAPDKAKGVSFQDYLEDTLAVIKAISPAPVLIGHSLGGLLALKAAEQTENIPALILLNPAPPAMLTAQPVSLPYFFPLLPKIFLGKPFLPSVSALKTLALQKIAPDEQDSIANGLIHESGIVYKEMMLGKISLSKNRKALPTLVVGSDDDRIISKSLIRTTVKKTNGELKQYANHGHWLIGEPGLERVTAGILEWLDDVLAK
jgi:pimeloyl-ACP methyl ester carboxylesterase